MLFGLVLYSCSENNFNTAEEDKTQSVNVQIREDFSCLDEVFGACSEDAVYSNLIEIPAYPGCYFNITLPYSHCADTYSGISTYTVGEPTIIDHTCFDYNDDIESAIMNGTINQLTNLVLSQILEEATVQLIQASSAYTSGQSTFEISYILGVCSQVCYTIEKEPNTGLAIIVPKTIECAFDCCKAFRKYKFDAKDDYVITNESIFSPDIDCEYTNVECPQNTLYSTECLNGCGTYF